MEGRQIVVPPSRCRVSRHWAAVARAVTSQYVQVLRAKSHSLRMKGQSMRNFDSVHLASIISAPSAFGIINN